MLTTMTNLKLASNSIRCPSGNNYDVSATGVVSAALVDIAHMIELGFQTNNANPFNIPWSTKSANFVCGPGSHGYTCIIGDDPATLSATLPPAAQGSGEAFFLVPSYLGSGTPGVITALPTGSDTIDGDPSRVLSVNSIFVSNGVDTWHHF